jgi:hypothetical protein
MNIDAHYKEVKEALAKHDEPNISIGSREKLVINGCVL